MGYYRMKAKHRAKMLPIAGISWALFWIILIVYEILKAVVLHL